MTSRQLTRIANEYVASNPRCDACRGCGSANAFKLPADVVSSLLATSEDQAGPQNVRISMPIEAQFSGLTQSLLLPLLMAIVAAFSCTLIDSHELIDVAIIVFAFGLGMTCCKRLRRNAVTVEVASR